MANFSLEDIKALRERLGTGMVDTKNALVEADGDVEKAVEILRLKGAKGNAKRADRSTSEGLVAVVESATAVTMIELACETDFVAKNEKFIALADKVVRALADSGAETVDAALAAPGRRRHRRQRHRGPGRHHRREGRAASRACVWPARSSPSTCTARARTCRRRSASWSPTRATTPRPLAASRSTSRSPTRST